MKADEICAEYAEREVGLTVKLLSDDNTTDEKSVLIEGTKDALKLLSELLNAVADEEENDGFSISPHGAGRIHFSENAELGVYIHRID